MPYQRISGSLSTPRVAVMIDMGNPFLNLTVDGFLKIGTVTSLHFRHFFSCILSKFNYGIISTCLCNISFPLSQVAAARAAAEEAYYVVKRGYFYSWFDLLIINIRLKLLVHDVNFIDFPFILTFSFAFPFVFRNYQTFISNCVDLMQQVKSTHKFYSYWWEIAYLVNGEA